jgi:hypothetical protein
MGVELSICRSMIESHHGHLGVITNDGLGVTFSFSIPGICLDEKSLSKMPSTRNDHRQANHHAGYAHELAPVRACFFPIWDHMLDQNLPSTTTCIGLWRLLSNSWGHAVGGGGAQRF